MVKKNEASTEAQFSYDDIQDAYENDLLPELKKAARAMHGGEAHAHFAKMGFTIPNLDGLKGEICKDWPMVKQFSNGLSGIGGSIIAAWIPSLAGLLGALAGFVAIMDQGVIPKICPVAASSGGTGIGGQGGSQR
jgi:hypothetical protein